MIPLQIPKSKTRFFPLELTALLAAENAYADAFVSSAGGGGFRARLAAEMRARLPPSAASPPQTWGPWSYYQYVPDGMEYPVLARKLRPSGGLAGSLLSYLSDWDKEEVLLDWNEIAEKSGFSVKRCSQMRQIF